MSTNKVTSNICFLLDNFSIREKTSAWRGIMTKISVIRNDMRRKKHQCRTTIHWLQSNQFSYFDPEFSWQQHLRLECCLWLKMILSTNLLWLMLNLHIFSNDWSFSNQKKTNKAHRSHPYNWFASLKSFWAVCQVRGLASIVLPFEHQISHVKVNDSKSPF